MITSTYTTPGADETEWVTETIEARLLKAGDFLHLSGEFVESSSNGTKWTHVSARSGKTLKFEMGEEIEIQREKLTKAAEQIRSREYAIRGLTKKVDAWRETGDDGVIAALDEARAQVTGERRYQLGSQLNYLMEVATQRARADLRAKVVWMLDDESSKTRGDVIATFRKAREVFTRELVESGRYNDNPLSRSSSTTANLAEDLERHERVQFLDDIRWEFFGIDEA